MIASMYMGRLGRIIVDDSDNSANEPQVSMPTRFHASRRWTELRRKGFRVSSIERRLRTRVFRSARWRAHLWVQRWIQTRCEWTGLHRFVVLNTWLSTFFPLCQSHCHFPYHVLSNASASTANLSSLRFNPFFSDQYEEMSCLRNQGSCHRLCMNYRTNKLSCHCHEGYSLKEDKPLHCQGIVDVREWITARVRKILEAFL